MFDPAQLTVAQVSSALRDLSIVAVIVSAVWKSRGWFEAIKKFFERLTTHMDVMEKGMNTLLTNHMTHIEQDLRDLAHRQVRATQDEQDRYKADDLLER